MNCQEVQSLMEDAIDRRLKFGAKRRFDLHLARCSSCRERLAAEQREHTRWFNALNERPSCPEALPPDFADRLVSMVTIASARRPFLQRLPRWVRIAASLAVVVSFTAIGSWIAATSTGNSDTSDVSGIPIDAAAARPTGDSGQFSGSSDLSESGIFSVTAFVPSITTETITMKPKLTATVLAVGTAVLPAATLQATTVNSCIISGSTARDCATTAFAAADNLDARAATIGFGAPLDPFEARIQTRDFGEAMASFRTDEPRGCVIVFR